MLACFTRRIIVAAIDLLLISFGLWAIGQYMQPCLNLISRVMMHSAQYALCARPIQGWELLTMVAVIGVLGYLSARLAKCSTAFGDPSLFEHKMRIMRRI